MMMSVLYVNIPATRTYVQALTLAVVVRHRTRQARTRPRLPRYSQWAGIRLRILSSKVRTPFYFFFIFFIHFYSITSFFVLYSFTPFFIFFIFRVSFHLFYTLLLLMLDIHLLNWNICLVLTISFIHTYTFSIICVLKRKHSRTYIHFLSYPLSWE